MMDILHPDFSDACMKCLREIFLKKSRGSSGCEGGSGQEYIKKQISKDIDNIQQDFLSLMEDF